MIPQVAASERGGAQTGGLRSGGVVGHRWGATPESEQVAHQSKAVEPAARDGESPVDDGARSL